MQQFKTIDRFDIISEEIISLTKEIELIRKKNNFDSDLDLVTLEDRYMKRDESIKSLNSLLNTEEGEKITVSSKWNNFIDEVIPIEEKNISFLEKKIIETRKKILKITDNKKLLLYQEEKNKEV